MKAKIILLTIFISINMFALGITGQKAPSFGVDTWIQTNGKTSLDIDSYKGKVLYVYGFQAWCPGCHSHGFPTLQKLSKHYKNDGKVAFVAIQTVFEGYTFNSINAAKDIIKKYSLTMPIGHSGSSTKASQFMQNYRSGGTPWTVIIDKNGRVRFNDFHADVNEIIKYMDILKSE
jgi:thiol-disulfide isomerase/thioredoxin